MLNMDAEPQDAVETASARQDTFDQRVAKELTDEDQDALDQMVAAIGSELLPAEWSACWAADGTFFIPLNWESDLQSIGSIGYLAQRNGGGWLAFEGNGSDGAMADADTLLELAELLAELWGGPGRWRLAALPKPIGSRP